MSEKELTDIFDKRFEAINKKRDEFIERNPDYKTDSWTKRRFDEVQATVDAAAKIMDALFEEVFL